jgi:uncharacterized membrane protein (DUF485 family)
MEGLTRASSLRPHRKRIELLVGRQFSDFCKTIANGVVSVQVTCRGQMQHDAPAGATDEIARRRGELHHGVKIIRRSSEGGNMAEPASIDWKAIDEDPRFQALHRKKTTFLWGLMVFSMAYYFLLPIGAAYFPELYRIRVWGPVNVGILFALSQFVVAWAIAAYYSHHANAVFDAEAAAIVRDVEKNLGGRK